MQSMVKINVDDVVCLFYGLPSGVTTDIVVGGANDFGRKGEIANW